MVTQRTVVLGPAHLRDLHRLVAAREDLDPRLSLPQQALLRVSYQLLKKKRCCVLYLKHKMHRVLLIKNRLLMATTTRLRHRFLQMLPPLTPRPPVEYIKETQEEDARVLQMNDEGGPPVNVFVDQAPSSSRRGTPKPQGISLIVFVLAFAYGVRSYRY